MESGVPEPPQSTNPKFIVALGVLGVALVGLIIAAAVVSFERRRDEMTNDRNGMSIPSGHVEVVPMEQPQDD